MPRCARNSSEARTFGAAGVAAQREDRRVLEQQQRVADEVLLASRDDLLLDGEAFRVGNSAEMEEINEH